MKEEQSACRAEEIKLSTGLYSWSSELHLCSNTALNCGVTFVAASQNNCKYPVLACGVSDVPKTQEFSQLGRIKVMYYT